MAHRYGMYYEDLRGDDALVGTGDNLLTEHRYCDPMSPYHKNVFVNIEKIA